MEKKSKLSVREDRDYIIGITESMPSNSETLVQAM